MPYDDLPVDPDSNRTAEAIELVADRMSAAVLRPAIADAVEDCGMLDGRVGDSIATGYALEALRARVRSQQARLEHALMHISALATQEAARLALDLNSVNRALSTARMRAMQSASAQRQNERVLGNFANEPLAEEHAVELGLLQAASSASGLRDPNPADEDLLDPNDSDEVDPNDSDEEAHHPATRRRLADER